MQIFEKLTEKKKNVVLLISSIIISSVALVVIYEIYETVKYYKWKADLDKGAITRLAKASSNKTMLWEYKAYGKYKVINTNRYGFREYDYESKNKPEGVYRIGFIGDSITLGWGCWHGCEFVRKYEQYANSLNQDQKVQALNFGIDGYNTLQIYELLATRAIGFQPDKVVYVMAMNDFDLDETSGEKNLYFSKPKSFFLLGVSKVKRKLSRKNWHVYNFEKNKEVVFEKIIEMKRLLIEQNIAFQVVIMPILPRNTGFNKYPLSIMHNEVEHFLKNNGVSVYDLLDSFEVQEEKPEYFGLDEWHLNAKGHDFVAQTLLRLNPIEEQNEDESLNSKDGGSSG